MRRAACLAATLVVGLTVACSDESGQPAGPHPSFSVTPGAPLTVKITAPTDLRDPDIPPVNQTLAVKVTASGGSGSYVFKWMRRICNTGPTGNYCEPPYSFETYPITTSGGTSTATHTFLKSDYKTWFVIEVQDANVAGGPSGVDSAQVIGPGKGFTSASGGSIQFTCDLGSNYPLTDAITLTDYRRNPCTGVVETK
jgi:hypothetical protein